ncbi:hypothetical protein FHS55_003317 [Angulomicrobium tetraedrale]|uniref:Uncharacterized protein n=1 Tax=Ancylobacter tetraedralis TaxID=217068 RepID=A0A839ZDF8_9HYPH|nr:hypothetical protein [Ancylobacter tetraedralis]
MPANHQRQIHLVTSLKTGPTARQDGGWRRPHVALDNTHTGGHPAKIARTLELATCGGYLVADLLGLAAVYWGDHEAGLREGGEARYLDPAVVLRTDGRYDRADRVIKALPHHGPKPFSRYDGPMSTFRPSMATPRGDGACRDTPGRAPAERGSLAASPPSRHGDLCHRRDRRDRRPSPETLRIQSLRRFHSRTRPFLRQVRALLSRGGSHVAAARAVSERQFRHDTPTSPLLPGGADAARRQGGTATKTSPE